MTETARCVGGPLDGCTVDTRAGREFNGHPGGEPTNLTRYELRDTGAGVLIYAAVGNPAGSDHAGCQVPFQ